MTLSSGTNREKSRSGPRAILRAPDPQLDHPCPQRARFQSEPNSGASWSFDTAVSEDEHFGDVTSLHGSERPVGGKNRWPPHQNRAGARDALRMHPIAERARLQPEERGGAAASFDQSAGERQGLHDVLTFR